MFEKEAEEYANEYGQDAFTQFNIPQMIEPVRIERKLGFQKGAEFGYKKGFEECAKSRLNVTTISDCPIKYDWHDLKKNSNDLPNNKGYVWCDYGSDYGKGFYNKDEGGWWIEGHMFCSAIDAWCELPTR